LKIPELLYAQLRLSFVTELTCKNFAHAHNYPQSIGT
jgi:hypothetical protein